MTGCLRYICILHVFNLVHPSRLPNLRVLVRAIYVFRNFGFLSVHVGSQDYLGFQSVRFRFQEKLISKCLAASVYIYTL